MRKPPYDPASLETAIITAHNNIDRCKEVLKNQETILQEHEDLLQQHKDYTGEGDSPPSSPIAITRSKNKTELNIISIGEGIQREEQIIKEYIGYIEAHKNYDKYLALEKSTN